MNHTPTPWNPGADTISGTHTPTPWSLGSLDGLTFNSPEDAAFIVRACNAHDDLVAALIRVTDRLEGTSKTTGWGCKQRAIAQARAAIEAAAL